MPVRKIETEISLGGEKQFNDAMKAANSNLKTLRSDMSAVSSEFRKNENSIQALTAKHKILRDEHKQQQEIVGALKNRLKEVEQAYGRDSAAADKLRQQLNAATVAMNKSKDALDQNTQQIIRHVALLDKSKDAYGAFGKTVANVADGAVQSFSNIAKAAGALSGVGVAAIGGLAALGGAAISTLTSYAADAGERAKTAYETANDLAEQARQAFLQGNEEAGMEYLRQANELIDGIDADYLKFGYTLDSLKKSTTSAKDALGKILLPALQDLSDQGAALLDSFAADMEAAAGDTEKQGEIIAEYVRRGVELIREMIPEFGTIAVELLQGLGAGFDENLDVILGSLLDVLDYILLTIAEHADDIGAGAALLINRLASFLVEHGPDLLASGAALVANIIVGLVQHLPDLIKQIGSLPGRLIEAFKNAGVDWKGIGLNIVNGIWEGLQAAWNELVRWFNNAIDSLISSIADALGIHSPSTVMRDRIGKNLASGVGIGFADEMQTVSRDMQQSMDDAIPTADIGAFHSSVSSAPGGSGGTVTNLGGISLVINGYNVQSDEELAELISYKLQELLERRAA